ncbi:hypothetical protein CHLRE_07g325722v5 [Chlamydomonas reinhardtii]|uniref:DEK-C domain-containing protein n=1 Tax=Chlamydomonas reinhardtii TaxID=3055 RepID=A0A2K3DJE4_CHLRE|nr:uncharacterized protein CHLRE_07g325722v5 [Chlamydomonas reinhardtii]PNW80646.1 hypothetical protein CHLRE_07g325722v5 [Chlamydomonas reinhardtii]
MADETGIVKQAVLEFLKTADMNVTTERTVLNHLAATLQLSQEVKAYKAVVSATIDDYLSALDDAEDEEEAAEQEEEEDAGAAKAGGRKRAGGAAGGAAAKKSRSSSGAAGGGGDDVLLHVDLSERRKARVRRYEGRLHVDVREFYKKDGEDAPTQKGLSMDPGQWARLARELPRLVAAQRAGAAGGGGGEVPPAQLAKTRLASVSEFKGTYYLGLREYYEKDGQLLPGKKGVSLNPSEAEALLAAAAAITTAAGGVPADLPPLEPSALLPTAGSGSAASGATAKASASAGPSKAAAAAAAAPAAGTVASGEPTEVVELGSNKRLSISHFGGRTSVDLREFYDKDGQKLPGKKGIALAPADWATMCAALPAISSALAKRDMGYVLQLSGKRRVSLSEFKGAVYVGVREFYEKDGQLLPGAKGLSMNAAQWAALVAGAPGFNAALQSQE